MATSPIYRNAVAPTYATGSSYTFTLASSTVNDVNIVGVNAFNGTGLIGVPAGWTTIVNTGRFGVFYRVFQSGDSTTIALTKTSASYIAAAGIAYSNVDTSAPIDVANWNIDAGTNAFGAVYRAPPVHPNFNGEVLAVFYGNYNSSATGAPTLPGSLTSRAQYIGGPSIVVADAALVDGTSTGNLDATWSTAGRFGCAVAVKGLGATAATAVPAEVTFGGVAYQGNLSPTQTATIDLSLLGVQNNDLIAIFFQSGSTTSLINFQSGYTSPDNINAATVLTHRWQTGDPLTLSFSGANSVYNAATVFVLRRAGSGTNYVSVVAAGHNTGASGSIASPSLTATDARDLLISVWSRPSTSAGTFSTVPTGLNSTDYNFTYGPIMLAAWKNVGTTGATSTPSAANNSSNTLNALSVLVSPDSATTVVPTLKVNSVALEVAMPPVIRPVVNSVALEVAMSPIIRPLVNSVALEVALRPVILTTVNSVALEVALPIISVNTGTARLAAPAAVIKGNAVGVNTGTGQLAEPAVSIRGSSPVASSSGRLTLTAVAIKGTSPLATASGRLAAPVGVIRGSGVGANVGSGRLTEPAVAIAGTSPRNSALGYIVVPAVSITGTETGVNVIAGSLVLPAVAITGHSGLAAPAYCSGSLVLPAVQITGVVNPNVPPPASPEAYLFTNT